MTVEGVRDLIRSLTQDFGPIFCLAIWSGVVLECPVVGRRKGSGRSVSLVSNSCDSEFE